MDDKKKADDHPKVTVQAAVAADAKSATVTAKEVPAPEPEPKTFAGKVDHLKRRFDLAVLHRDGEAIGKLYDELDKLKPSSPAEETAHRALGARFTHFAPRKLQRIKEIDASLDGAVKTKKGGTAPPPEHPAVTDAKADLARLDAEHQGNIPIPQDDEALDALNDKLAKVPPPAE